MSPITAPVSGGDPLVSRYASSIGGDLALAITGGVTTLPVADLHGDIATTFTLGPDGPVVGSWSSYDEYGNLRSATAAASTGTLSYGWLGDKQRANDSTGIILMGARLYNSVTGSFTSIDPVAGGNSTDYSYPQDPVNMTDISGRMSWRDARRHAMTAAACMGFGQWVCGIIGMITVAADKAANTIRRSKDRQNAVRHFIWSSLLASTVGVRGATVITNAHEYGEEGTVDSQADVANNRVAFRYARDHRLQKRWGPRMLLGDSRFIEARARELRDIGSRLYDQGKLHKRAEYKER